MASFSTARPLHPVLLLLLVASVSMPLLRKRRDDVMEDDEVREVDILLDTASARVDLCNSEDVSLFSETVDSATFG